MANEDNGLVDLLLQDRIEGKNYFDIEKKHGIPAAEARALVMEALAQVATKDPVEQRGILQLRLEKVVEHLWKGLETGSFKHGEAILRAAERIAELMDLNQATIKHEIAIISDQETAKLLEVLKQNNAMLFQSILSSLELTDDQRLKLDAWPQWAATASTEAVEAVIYMDEDDDGVYRSNGGK